MFLRGVVEFVCLGFFSINSTKQKETKAPNCRNNSGAANYCLVRFITIALAYERRQDDRRLGELKIKFERKRNQSRSP